MSDDDRYIKPAYSDVRLLAWWCGDTNPHVEHAFGRTGDMDDGWCAGCYRVPAGWRVEQYMADAVPHFKITPPEESNMNAAQKNVAVAELEIWWHKVAEREIEATVPKAIEYGAEDLSEVGRQLRRTGVAAGDTPDDELAIYFYLVGKMARWTEAIARGERASNDTVFDVGVYIRMVQRIRDTGAWPGEPPIVAQGSDLKFNLQTEADPSTSHYED